MQLLCEKCNTKKADVHDGSGHRREDCPDLKLTHFMQRWKEVRYTSREQIAPLEDEIQDLIEELIENRCNLLSVQKARSMAGTLKAWIRDLDDHIARNAVRTGNGNGEPEKRLEALLRKEAAIQRELQKTIRAISETEKEIAFRRMSGLTRG